jgi:tRNA pseudouridine55 synthase
VLKLLKYGHICILPTTHYCYTKIVVSIVNGLLSLDKPTGISSYDLINQVKKLFPRAKVGHSGTLDPLASGLLILGIGQATRALTQLLKLDKRYRATFRLGFSTDTDDSEGEIVQISDQTDSLIDLSRHKVERLLGSMLGPQQQTPPQFSAKKVQGRRAYAIARSGAQVTLRPSSIEVFALQFLGLGEIVRPGREPDDDLLFRDLDVEVHCSSGTYVRSLARDFGLLARIPTHVARLRRTEIGPYPVTDAQTLETFTLKDIIPSDQFLEPLATTWSTRAAQ